MKRPFPQTPAEFTQTIDVYDSDEGVEGGVRGKPSEMSGADDEDSGESSPNTPAKKTSILSDQSDDGVH